MLLGFSRFNDVSQQGPPGASDQWAGLTFRPVVQKIACIGWLTFTTRLADAGCGCGHWVEGTARKFRLATGLVSALLSVPFVQTACSAVVTLLGGAASERGARCGSSSQGSHLASFGRRKQLPTALMSLLASATAASIVVGGKARCKGSVTERRQRPALLGVLWVRGRAALQDRTAV
jgi:hypothetical protein